jgi:hypothetical protein
MGDVSVLTCFCPECWKETESQNIKCAHCGCNISQHNNLSYEEKLLAALRHQIRENRMLAIQLLGFEKPTCFTCLSIHAETERDFCVVREIAWSLAKIGSAESEDIT